MPDKPVFAAIKIENDYYGLSHLSAVFNIVDNPTEQLKASVASVLPSLASLPKQPDLLYISAILASQGANNNRDYFTKEDLVRAHNTSINKRISDNHGDEIIGHMTSSWLVDDKGAILTNEQALASKDRIHVAIGGVIYKYHYPKMAEDIKNSAGGKGSQKISMEALFPDCALIIGDESQVIASSDSKFNDIYGYWTNMADYHGKKVYRKLIGHFFSGSGITKNPANPPSIILAAASEKENCDVERGCVLIDLGKKTEASSCSCKTESTKENGGMSSESDMKAVAFDIDGEEAQSILTEIYDEGINEGLDQNDTSSAGSRPSKKKSGKRSPPKGYSKSSEEYGDPTNYSFAIDTADHTKATLEKFFENKSTAEYSVSEKLYMLQRIVRASQKFGIKVSDEIMKSAHIKASVNDEGAKADLGLHVPETQKVENKTEVASNKSEEKGSKMAEDTKELDGVKAELAKAKEALTVKDKELETVKADLTKVSEKAKADAEKAKADLEAKDKDIASKDKEIADSKAAQVLSARIKELTDAGLVPAVEADKKEQTENISTMDDKAFAFYKKSLESVKASKKDPAKGGESKAENKTEVPAPDLSGAKTASAALNASGEGARDLRAEMLQL